MPESFKAGDPVQRRPGKSYDFPGVVVAVFPTTAGHVRYVVESTSPDTRGMLHIYGPDDLVRREDARK